LIIQALCLLSLTALAVRLVGFRRWHFALASIVPVKETRAKKRPDSSLLPEAKVTAAMVRAAARHGLHRSNCLQQSLSLWWLLRRQGINSDIRIGVRKCCHKLQAHAWVEFAGIALNESPHEQVAYVAFERSIVPAAVNVS
jgi:hypothetical protein